MKIARWVALFTFVSLAATVFGQTVKEVVGFPDSMPSYGGSMTPVQGRDGRLYGTASGFSIKVAATNGAVVVISPFGGLVSLHSFVGTDGQFPTGVTLSTDGNLYGTTNQGGSVGAGVLFKVTSSGDFSILHDFSGGSDGWSPPAPPILASDGNLYGVTGNGTVDDGTVYRYSPSTGTFSTILSFNTDGSQGKQLSAQLLQGENGHLYGTAPLGGANGCGTVFELTTSGTMVHIFSFPCGAGGYLPTGPLIQASDGNLYGTTAAGGTVSKGECVQGCGTIFRYSHGIASVLYRFSGFPADGGTAVAGLTEGSDGNLYGGTSVGGTHDRGALYQITLNGQYKLLYSLQGQIGASANAALLQSTTGIFLGNASFDGRYYEGSLYSLDMGLGPFIALVRYTGRVGQPVQILGQGLKGSTAVTINGVPATSFKVVSNTFMTAVVPSSATSGPVVVTTPTGTLTSNHNLRIVQ